MDSPVFWLGFGIGLFLVLLLCSIVNSLSREKKDASKTPDKPSTQNPPVTVEVSVLSANSVNGMWETMHSTEISNVQGWKWNKDSITFERLNRTNVSIHLGHNFGGLVMVREKEKN